jgi:phage/plasmid-like protein (TIGR03299 family)
MNKTEILKQAGLDWNVRSEGIQSTLTQLIIPKTIVLIREDTNVPLGVHGAGYVPYQNEALLELLFKISQQTGLEYHTGGYFGNGEKVWFQLKSDDLHLKNDTIKGYISGFNSFDGKTSLAFGNTNFTVSCQNSFWMGYKNVQTKLRHSVNMIPRIDAILRQIDTLVEEEKQTFRKIERLAEIQMDAKVKELVIQKLFDITNEDKLADLSTRKQNQIDIFRLELDREIETKGQTLWGLFSGVTRYTTHSMTKGDNTLSKVFGIAGQKERSIWAELAQSV